MITLEREISGWRQMQSVKFASLCNGGHKYRHGFTTHLAHLLAQPIFIHHMLIECQSPQDAQQNYQFDPADFQFPSRFLPVELPLADQVVAYCMDFPNQTTDCTIDAHYGWLVSRLSFTTPTEHQRYPQIEDLIELAKQMDQQLAELGKE